MKFASREEEAEEEEDDEEAAKEENLGAESGESGSTNFLFGI